MNPANTIPSNALLEPKVMRRFWSKVQKGRVDECWVWTASKNQGGYGRLLIAGRKYVAHRISYRLLVGVIPDGCALDHTCRNRACVNPHHLEPVTPRENTLRGETPAAAFLSRTACSKGHVFTEDNVRIRERRGTRSRVCKTCEREAWDRFEQRRSAS